MKKLLQKLLGDRGERAAVAFLKKLGYKILARQFRNDFGEVDIIAQDSTYQGQDFDESEMHFVCPWHGWDYDITTGQCIGDRRQYLRKYEVVERDDDVFVIA